MKPIVLLSISIFFISGCDYKLEPGPILGGGGTDNDKYADNPLYYNQIEVRTYGGRLCISAMAQIEHRKSYADSDGTLNLVYDLNSSQEWIMKPVVVYKDTSDRSIFWEGKIVLTKGKVNSANMMKILFPDSL